MTFQVQHESDRQYDGGDLAQFFEFRDLGIREVTQGRVGARVIRCAGTDRVKAGSHSHSVDFQMIYILKGWARFWYDGHGIVELREGSCVHQPSGLAHREIEHSDDFKILEITMPASFGTDLSDRDETSEGT